MAGGVIVGGVRGLRFGAAILLCWGSWMTLLIWLSRVDIKLMWNLNVGIVWSFVVDRYVMETFTSSKIGI